MQEEPKDSDSPADSSEEGDEESALLNKIRNDVLVLFSLSDCTRNSHKVHMNKIPCPAGQGNHTLADFYKLISVLDNTRLPVLCVLMAGLVCLTGAV